MKYTRHIECVLTNKINNNKRTYNIDSIVTVTEIKDNIDGVHMVGTRDVSKIVNTQNWDAQWDITESFDFYSYRELLEGSTYYTTYEGNAHIVTNGTIRWNGGSKIIEKEVDVTFNKTRHVAITVNGSTIKIYIITGQQVPN